MNNEIKENLTEMLFNRDKRLLDYITNLQEENERLKREKIQKELCESLLDECDAHNKCLQLRIEKAIEYIRQTYCFDKTDWHDQFSIENYNKLLNILKGEDK